MGRKTYAVILTVAFAAIAMALNAHAPLGQKIWPPTPDAPEVTDAQLAGFMAYSVVEALGFGLGVAFLILGFPLVRRAAGSTSLAVATYLATGWLLVNWVPHDNLHEHVGMDPAGLLALEWTFHTTLLASGAIVALFFVRVLVHATRARVPAPAVSGR